MNRAKKYVHKEEQTLEDTVLDLFADQTFREKIKKRFADDLEEFDLIKETNKQKILNRKKSNNIILNEKRKALIKKNANKSRHNNNSRAQPKNKTNFNNKLDKKDFNSENESNSDIDSSKKVNPEEHPVIFFYENDRSQKKMYSFHRKINNIYNLRCTDRHCKGTADYDIETGKIIPNKQCTKNYENHSYIKEELIIKKIRAEEITKEDLIDNIENQEIYFKYLYAEHPNLTYYDICNYHLKN